MTDSNGQQRTVTDSSTPQLEYGAHGVGGAGRENITFEMGKGIALYSATPNECAPTCNKQ